MKTWNTWKYLENTGTRKRINWWSDKRLRKTETIYTLKGDEESGNTKDEVKIEDETQRGGTWEGKGARNMERDTNTKTNMRQRE